MTYLIVEELADTWNFQTPDWAIDLMLDLMPLNTKTVLEPTPGAGGIVAAVKRRLPNATVLSPRGDFFLMQPQPVDWVVANPPFTPMAKGYEILDRLFLFSPNVTVLMPWLTLINSERRTARLVDRGLQKVIHLPRRTFSGSRVQTCVLHFGEVPARPVELWLATSEPRQAALLEL